MLRRAMVAPVVKDTIEWKVTWVETRKAVCIWKEPYRKPTQVDRKKILRPAGEGLLRNSAS